MVVANRKVHFLLVWVTMLFMERMHRLWRTWLIILERGLVSH